MNLKFNTYIAKKFNYLTNGYYARTAFSEPWNWDFFLGLLNALLLKSIFDHNINKIRYWFRIWRCRMKKFFYYIYVACWDSIDVLFSLTLQLLYPMILLQRGIHKLRWQDLRILDSPSPGPSSISLQHKKCWHFCDP